MVATAELTSRSLALTTGAAAMMAELPQTAVPTPISVDTRCSTPRRRPTTMAKARAPPIVHSTSPIASAPISATVSRFSRSPSRMIPSLRTVRVENWMPGSAPGGGAGEVDHEQPQQHGQRDLEADRQRVGEGEHGGEVRRQADDPGQQQARKHAARGAGEARAVVARQPAVHDPAERRRDRRGFAADPYAACSSRDATAPPHARGRQAVRTLLRAA